MSDMGAIALIASAGAASLAYSIGAIANAVVRYRAQEKLATDPESTAIAAERLARLELAVESIALEVERISEGQRFTNRLMSEQAQREAPQLSNPATASRVGVG